MSLRALNVRWTFVQRRPQRSEEAEAQSAEQSGIRGVKRPFDPNIISLRRSEAICRCRTYGRNIKKIMIMQRILLLKILVILLNISWITLWQGKEYIRKILNL